MKILVDVDKLLNEAKDSLKNEDFLKAIEILEALYNDNPSEKIKAILIRALFSYGGYLNDDYILEYEKSMEYFRRIISLEPKNYKAFYNLGISFYNLGLLEDALDAYRTALMLNPNYKHGYYNIGLVYESTQEYQKAAEAYKKALEIDPNYIYALQALASVRQNLDSETSRDNQSQNEIETSKKLISLFDISKRIRIRIDMIPDILKISIESLIALLIEWGNKFSYEIDGDYIIIITH